MESGEPLLPKKARAGYLQWTSQESQLLMRLLVYGIRRGWRDSNGSMTKTTVEAKILPVLNKQLRCNKSYKHYMNQMKSLRKEYNGYAELLRCSSGFGWDPITKRFTAPDEVWKEYFKGHPNSENMRDNTFEDFEDLQIIFESATARGNNSFGLGDDTNAEAFEVENDVQEKEDEIHTENVIETNETTRRASKEKLPSRKRAKPNGDGDASESINPGDRSEKVLTEMIGVSTNIMNLMQQREERHQKEAEEKEAEKRKNNVWDAIKRFLTWNMIYAMMQ
uniref:Myb/SANT-like domain-containing protein n=1 Tax=Brassica campestris TaxID=3711 RepID=M4ERU7_BRACM